MFQMTSRSCEEWQFWPPPEGSVALMGEGSEKGQWLLPALRSGRKLPPALALILDYSVPPHRSLMPFNLLPPRWELRGSESL